MSRIIAIFFAVFTFVACKKTATDPNTTNLANTSSQPQSTYKRLKSWRSVSQYTPANWGPHISMSEYFYDGNGKISSLTMNDSNYYNNSWTFSSVTMSFSYTTFGKVRSMHAGGDSIYYVYDSNNKLKYEISGTDTTKFLYLGSSCISTRDFSNGYTKSYYSQNMDSIIHYNLSNTITGWSKNMHNTNLDLSFAYINQFMPVVDDHHELIQNHQYPTGNLPAIRSYTYTYDNNNYPIKRQCVDEVMTFSYY